MSSGSRRDGGGRPTDDADETTTPDRTGPSVAERPRTPAGDGDSSAVDGADEDGRTGAAGNEDGRVQWHRGDAGDQVVLAVETSGVRVAVAFQADAAHEEVQAALDERDRELRHFLRAGRGER